LIKAGICRPKRKALETKGIETVSKHHFLLTVYLGKFERGILGRIVQMKLGPKWLTGCGN